MCSDLDLNIVQFDNLNPNNAAITESFLKTGK